MKTLLLVSSIPQFNLAPDMKIHNKLNGFLNAEGILQTDKLSNHLINDLHGLIFFLIFWLTFARVKHATIF